MKLRNIFTMLAAALAFAFVGCQEEERFLEEVQVDKSFVAIPVTGGSVKVTVDAAAEWAIAGVPEWLTVSPASGAAGKTEVTFTAAKAEATNEAILELSCDGATQLITVLQLAEKVDLPITPCKEVNEGETGKRYRVKGTVTSIANTEYGNLYIQDETGTVYVYGTLYQGAEKQFSKHGIAVGDLVVVEGPLSPYNGSPQLKNVDVISIEKSLETVDPKALELTEKAGSFEITVDNKANCKVEVDADWIKFEGITTSGAYFSYEAYEVKDAPRTATITFTVAKGDRVSAVPVTITQYGITPDPIAIADAVAMPKGEWLSVTGVVTGVHKQGVIVSDAAGNSLYGYSKSQPSAKVGDVVVMTGKLGNYRSFYQIETPVIRVNKSGEKFSYPTATELTEELLAKWGAGKFTAQYITATGVADGNNYGAVTVAGHTISPYQTSLKMDSYYGKNVTIKGYTLQYQGGDKKDLRILVTSVEEVK